MAKPRSYTSEQRVEALRLYREVGPAEAGRRLDIPPGTVRKWAQRAGASAPRAARIAAAVKAAQLSRDQRRGDCREGPRGGGRVSFAVQRGQPKQCPFAYGGL